MRHIKNAMSGVFAVWLAVVTMLACGTGIFARAFADEPEVTEKIEIDEPNVDIYGGPFQYTGEQICPSNFLVTGLVGSDEVILENGVDYTYTCGENVEIGSLSGIVNFSDVEGGNYVFNDFTVNFPIWEHLQDISYETTTVEKIYGDDVFTNPLTETVVRGAITYVSSDEDVATVDDNGEVDILMPGETVITAVAAADEEEGYGEGVASYTLNVSKRMVKINAESVEVESKVYDGTTEGEVLAYELDYDAISDSDYELVATFDDKNIGENKNVNVKIKFTNEGAVYYQTDEGITTTATIEAYDIADAISSLSEDTYVYSGSENKPTVRVRAYFENGVETYLTEGEDFEVDYPEDLIKAGEKTVTVRGINNFVNEDLLYYDVETYSLTGSNVTLSASTMEYDGTAKTPGVVVKIGNYVVPESEYTVSYENNIEIGTATVTVTANDGANIDSFAVKNFEITGKKLLDISGIESQSVTYTGLPVVLAGNLTVAENDGGITADDLTATWYDEEGNYEIEQPIDAGSYIVVYSYDDENYQGNLTVEFTISKAESPMPAEMSANLTGIIGDDINDIEFEWTDGFYWTDDYSTIAHGTHDYLATYTYNGDEYNYTTLTLNVPVNGIARVGVYVDTDGYGEVVYPDEAYEGNEVVFDIVPDSGYEIRTVMVGGINITNQVVDNRLVLTAGTTDIELLVSFRRTYHVIEGNGLSYVVGSGSTARFRFDVDHELFVNGGKVYVDDMLIGEGYYTHTSGSTIITFTEEFMNFIGNGAHLIAVVFGDGGIARAGFSVTGADESPVKVPDTGFFTGNMVGARVAGLVTAVIVMTGAGVVFYKKKYAGNKIDFDKKK